MATQVKFVLIMILCVWISGCNVSNDTKDIHMSTVDMESYAVDNSKAYIYIESNDEGKYCINIYKNMGDIDYSYYTLDTEVSEDSCVFTIIKKNANNDSQCSNILNELVILERYPKDFRIVYNGEVIKYEIVANM